jgi:dienelactone hydrolase
VFDEETVRKIALKFAGEGYVVLTPYLFRGNNHWSPEHETLTDTQLWNLHQVQYRQVTMSDLVVVLNNDKREQTYSNCESRIDRDMDMLIRHAKWIGKEIKYLEEPEVS